MSRARTGRPLEPFGATWSEARHGLRADLAVARRAMTPGVARLPDWLRALSLLLSPPLLCCGMYRASHWLHRRGWSRLAAGLARLNIVMHRADLAPASVIGPGLYIPHTAGVTFRGTAGRELTLYARSAVIGSRRDPRATVVGPDSPILGDRVIIGTHALVTGPVHIGSDVVIGVGAVVRKDVGARSTVTSRRLISQRRRAAAADGRGVPA